ncbi:DUF6265 family protein [uncultured Paraglaciecola sp.]|uniref:DUF6265 family protein n=1 Tax=uncultured Paraglaciecola sp. TaxID=1765024 RepID=UPI002630E4F1|nr:DUF6265 family protein [uncultured Paraglaciecola sp.]
MIRLCFRYLFLLFSTFYFCGVLAQSASLGSETRQLETGQNSPPASIEDVSWIAGYWRGEIWGGQFEEMWSEPLAGSMMGSFKFVENKQIKFYELMTIAEHQDSLIIRLKHFAQDLKGWEEKDQSVDFKLVRLADKTAYFEGYTFKLIGPNEMHVFVMIGEEGKKQETKFVFKRHRSQ